ncbi:MAG: OsmC family protein [Hyphomonadaceae bacterium]|jgi:osmotically inducible protein OsmC|nr:OsmC family protein [Hyphomonadaceae bacterium]
MVSINRTASAQWQGTGREGKGTLTTQSGVLAGTPYGFNTRFGDTKGTNPEELLAASHAGCFSMALAFALTAAGFPPDRIATSAVVTLESDGPGFKISKSALKLEAAVPNISRDQFQKVAEGAKAGCPISKVLNADISLDWKLA